MTTAAVENPATTMTITEALAEIKTLMARANKKRQAVLNHTHRDSNAVDPLAKDGTSQADFVASGRQSIRDMEDRIVRIRTAIQSANLATSLTIGIGDRAITRTVTAWLNWRKEISVVQREWMNMLNNQVVKARAEAQRFGGSAVNAAVSAEIKERHMVVNFNEVELMADIENMEAVLGELDGKLSLVNATVKITV